MSLVYSTKKIKLKVKMLVMSFAVYSYLIKHCKNYLVEWEQFDQEQTVACNLDRQCATKASEIRSQTSDQPTLVAIGTETAMGQIKHYLSNFHLQ